MSRYQKGKSSLDFTEARDSEWQWHQLGHMQVCTSLQTDNHASTPPLSFLHAGCPSSNQQHQNTEGNYFALILMKLGMEYSTYAIGALVGCGFLNTPYCTGNDLLSAFN